MADSWWNEVNALLSLGLRSMRDATLLSLHMYEFLSFWSTSLVIAWRMLSFEPLPYHSAFFLPTSCSYLSNREAGRWYLSLVCTSRWQIISSGAQYGCNALTSFSLCNQIWRLFCHIPSQIIVTEYCSDWGLNPLGRQLIDIGAAPFDSSPLNQDGPTPFLPPWVASVHVNGWHVHLSDMYMCSAHELWLVSRNCSVIHAP